MTFDFTFFIIIRRRAIIECALVFTFNLFCSDWMQAIISTVSILNYIRLKKSSLTQDVEILYFS